MLPSLPAGPLWPAHCRGERSLRFHWVLAATAAATALAACAAMGFSALGAPSLATADDLAAGRRLEPERGLHEAPQQDTGGIVVVSHLRHDVNISVPAVGFSTRWRCPRRDLYGKDGPSIADLAGTRQMPPYYLIFIAAVTKPIINLMLFGPPAPRPAKEGSMAKAKGIIKQLTQLIFFAMALATTAADCKHIYRAAMAPTNVWRRCCSIIVILATSSNLQGGYSAMALLSLTEVSLKWAHAHNYMEGATPFTILGPVGFVYLNFVMFVYVPIGSLLTIFVIPSFVAYAYIFAVIYFVCLFQYFVVTYFAVNCLARCKGGTGSYDAQIQEATTQEEAAEKIVVLYEGAQHTMLTSGDFLTEYGYEMTTYKLTGVPRQGWVFYATASILYTMPVILFAPMAARLYSGHGYVASMMTTLTERRITSFAGCSVTSASGALGLLWLWL